MSKLKKVTAIVIGIATVVLIGYDLWVYIAHGSKPTISNVMLELGSYHPAIPMFMGGLVSHLFWTGKTLGPRKIRVIIGAVLIVGVEVVAMVAHLYIPTVWTLAAGVVLGRVLVPQEA